MCFLIVCFKFHSQIKQHIDFQYFLKNLYESYFCRILHITLYFDWSPNTNWCFLSWKQPLSAYTFICQSHNSSYICIVKFFITIFSIYITVLAIMPCTDAATCEKEVHTENATAHQHNHREDDTDSCSPFCVCSCCGVVGIYFSSPQLFFTKTKTIHSSVLVATYNSEFISSYYYTFWQPPKI